MSLKCMYFPSTHQWKGSLLHRLMLGCSFKIVNNSIYYVIFHVHEEKPLHVQKMLHVSAISPTNKQNMYQNCNPQYASAVQHMYMKVLIKVYMYVRF